MLSCRRSSAPFTIPLLKLARTLIVSPGMWRRKSVLTRLSLSILIRQSGFFLCGSSGTVSPNAMSTHPPSISALLMRTESPMRFMPWLTRCKRCKSPRIRRSPIKLTVFVFSFVNVSSLTSTLLLSKGNKLTSATKRCMSATVSFLLGIESLGRSIFRPSNWRSNGKERLTRSRLTSIPVFSET